MNNRKFRSLNQSLFQKRSRCPLVKGIGYADMFFSEPHQVWAARILQNQRFGNFLVHPDILAYCAENTDMKLVLVSDPDQPFSEALIPRKNQCRDLLEQGRVHEGSDGRPPFIKLFHRSGAFVTQ